ncbi:MAG TPA: hypothetical protein VG754_02885 [Verrucomicrobiae bacterium]|nr:hypothetical protein [Verrucomicrobiae bacterium]
MKTKSDFLEMMKRLKVKRAVAVGTGVMMTIAASMIMFAQTNKEAADPFGGHDTADGKTLIVPLESVGPLRREMTSNEVVAILGQPERMQGKIMVYGKTFGLAIACKTPVGVAAVFCGDSSGDGPGVKAFKCRTKEGIGMESTRAEIIKAFGQPTSAKSGDAGLHQEELVYQPLGLTFYLQNGKVYNILVDFRKTHQPQ